LPGPNSGTLIVVDEASGVAEEVFTSPDMSEDDAFWVYYLKRQKEAMALDDTCQHPDRDRPAA
jgi:hypothetical protein